MIMLAINIKLTHQSKLCNMIKLPLEVTVLLKFWCLFHTSLFWCCLNYHKAWLLEFNF